MNTRSREQMDSGPYPVREGEPDCSYYIRTGVCTFGSTCRFNHPPNRKLEIKELNIKTKNWKELLTDEPFTRDDIITIQNPNALDTKVLVDFDHIKKNLKIYDKELKKMESDPSYDINDIGDIKQLLKELGTEKAKEIALHFRRDERADALEAI